MKTLSKILLLLIFLVLVTGANAQNRFEGLNIIVDAPDTQTEAAGACATRYVPTTTDVTITDLDLKTPLKLQSCGGNNKPVRQINQTTAVVQANDVDYKWCFAGEDRMYRVTFGGDRYAGKITYNWIATPPARELGFYNVRDFGAAGDGKTDDTVAIRSALAFVAARNGGRLLFPDGDYLVGSAPEYPNFKGLALPSGIVVEGTGSNNTGSPINNIVNRNASRISLTKQNAAVFRIGECTERVVVRDIELNAQSDTNTYGIEAVGAFQSSQDFYFDRVAFTKFFRGIYAHFLPANNQQWQFDFVKINGSRFVSNRDAGIWIELWNTDWAIKSVFLYAPPKTANTAANGIYMVKAGTMLIEDTFGGGPPGGNGYGGDFINLIEGGNLSIISSQCEKMARSLVFGDVPGAGNLSFNLTLFGNTFGDPIEVNARKVVVSTGNFYLANTFKLHPDAQIYSVGDRFCYDGSILGCQGKPGPTNFIGGKIIFATGQLKDQAVPGRPTVFGHDVQMNAPLKVSNVPFEQLPANNIGDGSLVYCKTCRRNSSPCQNGGTGAPAMLVNGSWNCL